MVETDAEVGLRLAREGRADEALPWLERANRAAPTDLRVLHALGNLLANAGRGMRAQQRYRLADTLAPGQASLLCGWVRIALMSREPGNALALCEKALAADPGFGNSGGWLQGILHEVADPDVAVWLLGELAARHRAHFGLHALLAKAQLANENLDAARAALEACLALRPDDSWARVQLGGLEASHDDRARALAHYRAVPEGAPGFVDALHGIAELNGWRLHAAMLAAVRRATAAETDLRRLSRLHQTQAKHHDRAGEHPAAWRHAARANALAVEAAGPANHYDADEHARRIDLLVREQSAGLFERLRGAGSADLRPVFVLGLPRSGTTLLERMLAAHPRCAGVGEQHFAEVSWRRALAACGGSHGALSPAVVREAAAWHLDALGKRMAHLGLPAQAERVVDKLPDNYLMAGWLSLAFPNAAIVHVQRDPRDVAISCWFEQFANIQWINELRHIAHRIEQHRRLLRHWRATLGARLIEIRYEALACDPEAQLRRVLDAMRMEWHPAVLAPSAQAGYVATASRLQVREDVHTRGIGRWRPYAVALEPILARLDAVATEDALDLSAVPGPGREVEAETSA